MIRSVARDRLNSALGNPATGGIYTAAQLSDALDDEAAALAPRFPVEKLTNATVSAGATTLPLPADLSALISVALPTGAPVQRLPEGVDPTTTAELAYTVAGSTLTFSRALTPSEAGGWILRYRAVPTIPTTDTAPYPYPDSLMPAVIFRAAAVLIRTRSADDARRGHRAEQTPIKLAEDFERRADAIEAAHRRTARGYVAQ